MHHTWRTHAYIHTHNTHNTNTTYTHTIHTYNTSTTHTIDTQHTHNTHTARTNTYTTHYTTHTPNTQNTYTHPLCHFQGCNLLISTHLAKFAFFLPQGHCARSVHTFAQPHNSWFGGIYFSVNSPGFPAISIFILSEQNCICSNNFKALWFH